MEHYCSTLSSILISGIFIPLHYEVLEKGAVHAIAAKWTLIAEKIMERRSDYFNPYQELEISGLKSRLGALCTFCISYKNNVKNAFPITADKGRLLADINPAKDAFQDTAKTSKVKQLKDLHTAMRSQYNLLLSRITASGSHSANEDLTLHAYNRCGVENRGKDVGLFFYYMCVKESELELVRLNTRCHLLAFAAKVEKQLQATVSIQ